jgi:hypothetical protein
MTDRVHLKCIEEIEGDGGQQVEQEPSADVVERYQPRIVNHLPALAYIRCAEIEDDI